MDIEEIKRIFQEESRKTGGIVQYHIHNGIDSPNTPFTSIQQHQRYAAFSVLTLSSVQILALNATPVITVPKIEGNFIIVDDITLMNDFMGTAYTGANAMEFRYTDAAGAKVTADIPNTFINAASDSYATIKGVVTVLTPVISSPIITTVPVASPATGNGRITIITKYHTVAF